MSSTITLTTSLYPSAIMTHPSRRPQTRKRSDVIKPLPLPPPGRCTVAAARDVDPVVIRRLREAYAKPWGRPIPPTQRKAEDLENMYVALFPHREKGKEKQSEALQHTIHLVPASPPKSRRYPSDCTILEAEVCPVCATPLRGLERQGSTSSISSSFSPSRSRSPLFDDDDDDDDISSASPPSALSRSNSSSSPTPPSQSPFLSLLSKSSSLPPQRRALLLEAKSWPIFASTSDASVFKGPQCDCVVEAVPVDGTSLERRRSTGGKPPNRRPSASSLVPTPAFADPLTEALKQRESEDWITIAPIQESTERYQSDPVVARPRKSRESLLTKSLRQLNARLPNIQWGHLIPAPPPPGEDFLRRGVLDFHGIGAGFGIDDWVTADVRNRGADPELEWSSMMVQLQTFSTSSVSVPRTRPSKPSTTPPDHSEQVSITDDDQDTRRGRSRGVAPSIAALGPRPVPSSATMRSPGPSRVGSGSNELGGGAGSADMSTNVLTRRIVSNPYHLLQLALELEMMRERKIRAPLRPRAVKIMWVSGAGGGMQTGISWQMRQRKREESLLRWEVCPQA